MSPSPRPLDRRTIANTTWGRVGALIVVVSLGAACTGRADSTTTTEPVPTTSTVPPTTTTTTTLPPTTTTEPRPRHPQGGVVIAAADQEPTTLNTWLPGGFSPISRIISQSFASGVYDIDPATLEPIPELVTELPTTDNGGVTVNDDGTMTVTYDIRPDATWADGMPVSGADFAFTLGVIQDPDIATARYPPEVLATYQSIESTEVGPKRFSYTLPEPTIRYEVLFDEIIPKHAVEGTNFVDDWNDRRWVSSGPFSFDEWQKGESLTVVRNPNYWKHDPLTDQQLPYLDSVTWTFLSDERAMLDAFGERAVDIVNPSVEPERLETVLNLAGGGARVDVSPGPIWEHLGFQFGRGRLDRNPTSCGDQLALRQAVAQAVDRDAIAGEILHGTVGALDSYVDVYAPGLSTEAWSAYEHDPDAATRSYLDAVVATGRECSVVFTTSDGNDARVTMAKLLSDMFAEARIPFETQTEHVLTFLTETLDEGDWDLGEWHWNASPGMSGLVDFADNLDPDGPPPDGDNVYRWGARGSSVIDDSTERYAEIHDLMQTTVDRGDLMALISEAEQILADQVVIIPLYARPVVAVVWEDEVGNFVPNPSAAGYSWNLEYWYRADR